MSTSYLGAFSWNLVDDLRQLFAYHFMTNALAAGTIVAVMAAVIGWFMTLRKQTFVGHTLAVIAFPGATAATLAGLPAIAGYFTFSTLGALVLGRTGSSRVGSRSHESALIGTVQAFALGLGFLFVSLYHGQLENVSSLLFGTFLGITDDQVLTLLGVAIAALAILALIGRPLLFTSIDPEVARTRRIPVRGLSLAFLLLLGLAVAETSQITGALLVFALLVTPAATAQTLTTKPAESLTLSIAIAVLVTWSGLAIAFFSPYPVGFWVTSLSFALFVLARIGRARESTGWVGTSTETARC
jgi:zinc/manganese transport system permease protein